MAFKEFETKQWFISIWEQWNELLAERKEYNWKNFSVIELSFEYSDHLYPKGSFEVVFQLLGLGLRVQYVPDKPPTEDMEYLLNLRDKILNDEAKTYKWSDISLISESDIRNSNVSHDITDDGLDPIKFRTPGI